jgi:hypothetical protein
MSGLGLPSPKGKLVTLQADLPETVDGILDKLREILLKGDIQLITIKDGEPIMYQRVVQHDEEIPAVESTQSFAGLGLMDIVRNTEMEEFDPKEQGLLHVPGQIVFFWAYLFMEHQEWVPSFLLVGEDTQFWSWLSIPKRVGRKLDRFVGLRVERDKIVPPDVFILCGARHRGASITEVKYSLKVSTEVHDA